MERKIREVGALYALTLAVRTVIPAPFFRFTRMVILEIRLPEAGATVEADTGIRWAMPHDSPLLEAFGHGPGELDSRFRSGARACVFIEQEALLAYVWFHEPAHEEENLGVRFALGPGEIWLFDAMVEVNHRGRGLYPRLLGAAVRDLGREGVRRILIAIDSANGNSVRAHQAAGAEPIGVVSGLRLLGFTFVRHGRTLRAAWTGTNGYVRVFTDSIAEGRSRRPPPTVPDPQDA